MRTQKRIGTAVFCLLLTTLAACSGRSSAPDGAGGSSAVADPRRAACMMKSPYLKVGAGLDAPGRLEVPVPAVGAPATCKGNKQFRFGSGLYDITGVVANTSGMGWENPAQVFGGLHTRQYARAFAIESPCNGKRVMIVVADIGIMTGALRLHALEAIAADPELAGRYGPENLMLSATHTHQGPAGYSHFLAHNLLHLGFDDATFQVTADGIVQALKRADANLRAHPDSARIGVASGELLNTSIQRSAPAYEMNSEAERREFLNRRGEEVRNNKRVVQLNLVRGNGSPVGILNWFGVHGTVVGENLKLVSSDNKGYAALGFERIMKAGYAVTDPGIDSFVAAFAQADQGDASPNIFILERPYPDPTRGGGADDYESNAISGTKHIAKALELYARDAALSGPVDYRLFHVKMDEVEVTDPVVLASLKHPAEMDAAVKRTCSPALGPSFAAGAEDGPGPAVEGVSCASGLDLIAAAAADFQTLLAIRPPADVSGFPPNILPLNLVSAVAMCQLKLLPPNPVLGDFSCQAEKPVALPLTVAGVPAEPLVLPFQIVRLGNLALIGLPWEVPTMSARRIRKMMLDVLAPAGVDTVVVAPLTNDFVHYLPTREEYASQQYEGASDIFGPWTLAAVQQELRKLAATLRDGTPAPEGPDYVDGTPVLLRPPYVAGDLPLPRAFGSLVTDVPATATPGDTVTAEFQSGHPRNDLRTQQSYVYAEREKADGSWEVVAEDRDPELWFVWKPALPQPLPIDLPVVGGGLSSTAEAVWHIPKNLPAGTYRLRLEGAAQTLVLPKVSYTGLSSPFTVAGPVSDCP
ncbi:neutral/alkaline non-lysosomal ceramidase N-terminal domain-containing protein [Solimonas sp. K1W22B-7]|uniref:neutral/alkaline non-lysosomal ceramidase N-terminal domain-containing protein n=1 Tax=Solimonas sp. K1W22B-7 TaxID=2303331 RepID=UPI0013C4BB81|nr:neutral/alkaline non-lysosomal ceramidase N-terminal domain-containing protein [Solimonas sp. K1W22B-7]